MAGKFQEFLFNEMEDVFLLSNIDQLNIGDLSLINAAVIADRLGIEIESDQPELAEIMPHIKKIVEHSNDILSIIQKNTIKKKGRIDEDQLHWNDIYGQA